MELTGGVSEKINLKMMQPSQEFWKEISTLIEEGHMVGCALVKRSYDG